MPVGITLVLAVVVTLPSAIDNISPVTLVLASDEIVTLHVWINLEFCEAKGN